MVKGWLTKSHFGYSKNRIEESFPDSESSYCDSWDEDDDNVKQYFGDLPDEYRREKESTRMLAKHIRGMVNTNKIKMDINRNLRGHQEESIPELQDPSKSVNSEPLKPWEMPPVRPGASSIQAEEGRNPEKLNLSKETIELLTVMIARKQVVNRSFFSDSDCNSVLDKGETNDEDKGETNDEDCIPDESFTLLENAGYAKRFACDISTASCKDSMITMTSEEYATAVATSKLQNSRDPLQTEWRSDPSNRDLVRDNTFLRIGKQVENMIESLCAGDGTKTYEWEPEILTLERAKIKIAPVSKNIDKVIGNKSQNRKHDDYLLNDNSLLDADIDLDAETCQKVESSFESSKKNNKKTEKVKKSVSFTEKCIVPQSHYCNSTGEMVQNTGVYKTILYPSLE